MRLPFHAICSRIGSERVGLKDRNFRLWSEVYIYLFTYWSGGSRGIRPVIVGGSVGGSVVPPQSGQPMAAARPARPARPPPAPTLVGRPLYVPFVGAVVCGLVRQCCFLRGRNRQMLRAKIRGARGLGMDFWAPLIAPQYVLHRLALECVRGVIGCGLRGRSRSRQISRAKIRRARGWTAGTHSSHLSICYTAWFLNACAAFAARMQAPDFTCKDSRSLTMD